MIDAVDVAQLLFECPGPADAAVGARDLVDQGAFVVGELVFPGAQCPAGGLPVWGAHRGAAGPGGGFGVDAVQGAVDPLHDVERVITDGGLGGVGAGGAAVGFGDVHADHLDVRHDRIRLAFIEIRQGLLAASGLDIDHGAGVVIANDGQIAVRVAVADLIDTDPIQRLESAGIEQLGDPTVDDRGDRFPAAAHQGGHRGAVGALGQPQHRVFEIAGMPCPRARPGQLFGAHPALRAVQPADLIDQPQPVGAQVEVAPATSAPVIDRRAEHPARAGQQPGARTQGDFDVAGCDDHIGHPRPGDLQQTVKCSTDAHVVPPVAVGVVTPKPRATPRARPSFHPRNPDTPLLQQNPPLTSTKTPTKTRGAPPMFDELVATELIDQIRFTPHAEYTFHHPLIRAVAYESQLKSDRAEVHRRLAAAIESLTPQSADHNAALIAEHLEAAGELRAAHAWHMRTGGWLTNRDIAAARLSWARARQIADALPDDADRSAMCIAPRSMLCLSAVRVCHSVSGDFADMRELCSAAGDEASLAIAMTGPAFEHLMPGRAHEASRLASEQMALLESIGEATMTIGLASWAIAIWFDTGEIATILRWSQTVIDLAGSDPTKGSGFGFGSPLAVALASPGVARWWLGRDGWREDLDHAVVMARNSDPVTHAAVATYKYGWSTFYGVLRADAYAVRALEDALKIAEGSSDDTAVRVAKFSLGVTLVLRDAVADQQRGVELLMQVREMWLIAQDATARYLCRAAGHPDRRPRRCHIGDGQSRG